MLAIFIQIIFYQLLFLALYEGLLKRDTHYNLQRYYLLLLPIVAMILPYVVVPSLSGGISEAYQISLPTVLLGESTTKSEVAVTGTIYGTLLIVWAVGTLLSSMWFLWKYRKLHQLRATAHIVAKEKYKLATLPNTDLAFSFGRTIYLGEDLEESAREVILKHEKVHIAHKHSIDLLLFQLLRILFWWNPILYLFQNRLEAVHEYVADEKVVQHVKKKEYYQNLLSQVFKTNGISFTNTFYKQSLIKNRILMLQKIKSSRKSKFKYLLLLPLLAFMLVVASCATKKIDSKAKTEEMTQSPMTPAPEKGIVEEVEIEPVAFSAVETAPTFPGCEGEADLSACMNAKILEHVIENFNKDLAKELELEGVQRIMVMFTIDTFGDVTDIMVRGPHKEIDDEARRVIELLPQFIPGKMKGKEIPVSYTLPIQFEV